MDPPCKQAAESGSRVPDELLEDIFARMPAKSVQRCRCLSRAWAAALSSSAFVDRHLRLANRRDGSRSLFFLPDPDSGDDTTVHAWSPRRPLVAVRRDERLRRVAAVTRQCRGLVVLEAKGENLPLACNPARGHCSYTVDHYVYNPSTGQVTALPEGKEASGVWPQNHAILGLGYDPSIRKHKVVRLYCRGELPPACEVYVLDSTGYWRPPSGADRTMLPAWATNYCTDQSVFAQGHVYWAAQPHKNYTGERVVMSFSMADEVFGILRPPDMDTTHWRITELGGRLCLFKDISAVCSYDIWILRDPLTGAWDLHCRINLDAVSPAATQLRCSTSVIPLDIVDDGNRVLLRPEPCNIRRENLGAHQLVVYDPATGDVEDLLADGSMITHHTMMRRPAAPYEESLESTGRPHEDIIFSSTSSQVLAQVLRRLPARILGRLKCVCRTWRAIIESGRFIRLHYEHTGRSTLARVVLSSMPYDWQFASLDSCLNDLKLACQMQQLHRRVVSSKPCHGLLLIAHNSYGVHVCNPVTGAQVFHSLPFKQPSDAAAAHPGCVGLGYDLLREEHIIIVLAYKSRNFDTGSYSMECSIRRLTDCMTKKVAPSPPIPVTVDVPPVYAGGKMYWMGESRFSAGCSSILVFDICRESFDVLPAPLTMGDSGRMLVAELTGQVRVVHICPNTETMTIWHKQEPVTLNDGRGWTREHWIQLGQWPDFSLRTEARLVIPLAVDDAGRVLLDTGRALGYYDPRNQTLETVYPTTSSSLQLNYRPGFFFAVLCEDSLVRPNCRQRQYF
ncbi:unnamed protein product [Triticum turgidum subsp. durum]|uniref:F-box domain-containing protein n=1 Tax=Triticum turgidum subsp. durum TaxID=4567 RepID=A0A9R0W5V0_TRITD|nr:unnamed protein product [Triticum turgidum subsp. durum]